MIVSQVSNILNSIEDTWKSDPARCIEMMESAMPGKSWQRFDAPDHLRLMREYIVKKEWHERMKRGLAPFHCRHIGELFFSFVTPSVLEAYGKAAVAAGSSYDIACWLFVQGERERPEALFSQTPPDHIGRLVHFSPDFPECSYPSFQMVRDFEPNVFSDTIFLGCSETYWKFAEPFIRSIKAKSKAHVHLHMMDMRGNCDTTIADGFSMETVNAGPAYYHSMRFIRLYQWMQTHQGNAWLMDVDAIMNYPPNVMFNGFAMSDHDVALRARPGRLEPWNQLNASVVGFKHADASMNYLDHVCRYIMHHRGNLAWGIDQLAMFCAFEVCRPSAQLLGPKEVDYDYQDDGVIWNNSGGQKHKIGGSGRSKYYEAFNRYKENADAERGSEFVAGIV